MRKAAAWTLMLVLPGILPARDKQDKKVPVPQEQRVVRAVRADEPVTIDGVLSEKVWRGQSAGDFVMSEPVDGGKPTERTEVWVAYDDAEPLCRRRALTIPIRRPSKKLLGRRDDEVDSDWFIFAVDPYFDRRTGLHVRRQSGRLHPGLRPVQRRLRGQHLGRRLGLEGPGRRARAGSSKCGSPSISSGSLERTSMSGASISAGSSKGNRKRTASSGSPRKR